MEPTLVGLFMTLTLMVWLVPRRNIKGQQAISAYKVVVQKIDAKSWCDALMKIGFGRAPGTGLPGMGRPE